MKRRLVTGIAVASCAAVGGIFTLKFMGGPSVGTVKQQSGLSEVKGAQFSLKQVSTSYFSMSIDATQALKSSNESGGQGVYAQYLYSSPAFGDGGQLGVTLGHLNGLTLSEVPFAKQRSISPDIYMLVSQDSSSITYQTLAHDEYVTIWLHGNDYVAVAASGRADRFGSLKDAVTQAIQSWEWR